MLRRLMRIAPSFLLVPGVLGVLGVVSALALTACPEPKSRPEVVCAEQCEKRLSATCDDKACARGCLFILDRLVEKEGATVLSCMEHETKCDDGAWANCAARVGVHADGGPAAPPPPPEE